MADEARNKLRVKIMRSVEIPLLTRCCFCVPLRRGLIAMAYIILVTSSWPLSLLIYNIHTYDPENPSKSVYTYNGYSMRDLILEFVLECTDFMITIVLIVGLHMKKVVLMKWYLYVGIVILLVDVTFALIYLPLYVPSVILTIIAWIMTHIYTFVLVWSSVVKIARDGTVKYSCSEDQT